MAEQEAAAAKPANPKPASPKPDSAKPDALAQMRAQFQHDARAEQLMAALDNLVVISAELKIAQAQLFEANNTIAGLRRELDQAKPAEA